jgi:hypothetical protein
MMSWIALDLKLLLAQNETDAKVLSSLECEIFKWYREFDNPLRRNGGIAADLLKRLS